MPIDKGNWEVEIQSRGRDQEQKIGDGSNSEKSR